MLIPKNNANLMRTKILIKLAESYLENKFEDADRIPLALRPKDGEVSRCCVYKDRAVLKYRCMAGLGHCPEEETDELTSLKEYGQEALIFQGTQTDIRCPLSFLITPSRACLTARIIGVSGNTC